ncbi:DUF484 family protein [Pseudoalteromonas tunicata]|uniref:Uncharacterized protein n=1 Tax=Pseudoalteromonas tunicata D2 TaxID=87626 RepID=A4CFE2_9GAMM|nr:DUF484 family protein [Pseudoalteromonas tunicata]ATC92923.1 hypothetical protein PTUN_a0078 [Pseudoalteromonas tunicata]AXT32023.1 DUF484 family protein [Pseudoalteromonas tunicata]EAR26580.1 hypothetical protein PTD2_09544 [Pseudoalteromonas tunicata D2]MDP4985230.1 DUF484 family protein [Pseudoalteromonas tunicata]MDP5214761.1 DUF484 family protein [Pseudoalteromonas tunicata]
MSQLDANEIAEYLALHPDFLVQFPELLDALNLYHNQPGAISLQSHQQKRLQQQLQQQQQQLNTLLAHARKSEQIYQVFSSCHRHLMLHDNFADLASNLVSLISANLDICECKLLKYEPYLASIVTHRLANQPRYLGRINQQEQALLFNNECQSVALYLIGDAQTPLAILAFASKDPIHFEPSQDSFFINEFVKALHTKLSGWV